MLNHRDSISLIKNELGVRLNLRSAVALTSRKTNTREKGCQANNPNRGAAIATEVEPEIRHTTRRPCLNCLKMRKQKAREYSKATIWWKFREDYPRYSFSSRAWGPWKALCLSSFKRYWILTLIKLFPSFDLLYESSNIISWPTRESFT